jgi:uroporphyrinogen decarboxylase
MLAPDDLRRLVFPWYKKISETAHEVGKPVILHSCGNPLAIIDDIIDDIKIDGKHSFEDTIVPVEDAIDRWNNRIAIIGGIDLDFLANQSINEIKKRTRHIRDMSRQKGGIAIGSGNSIPDYIPTDHYCAMMETILELD